MINLVSNLANNSQLKNYKTTDLAGAPLRTRCDQF
jgi:hypothetical protein